MKPKAKKKKKKKPKQIKLKLYEEMEITALWAENLSLRDEVKQLRKDVKIVEKSQTATRWEFTR